MPIAKPQIGSAPFDLIAENYDRIFSDAKIGQAQRAAVRKALEKEFHAGHRVLEIGCGTGADACFLAERGVEVVACDSSPGMVAVTAQKVALRGLQHFVKPCLLAAEYIGGLQDSFDGAFSNFGVLNCVPDLPALANDLGRLLRPGATMVLCLMGHCCMWEIVWYLAHGNPRKAFRRLRRGGITARVADGPPVRVYYPRVSSLARAFTPHFRLRAIKGVGVLVPPSYLEFWADRFPRLLRSAVQADAILEACRGVRLLADHVVLTFERRRA
jgi:ubiquinone/menaquinone biosynthesis C-methylase UbiE